MEFLFPATIVIKMSENPGRRPDDKTENNDDMRNADTDVAEVADELKNRTNNRSAKEKWPNPHQSKLMPSRVTLRIFKKYKITDAIDNYVRSCV